MRTLETAGIISLIFVLLVATPALALPTEKDPLLPRVPLEKRGLFKNLSSPLYNDSKLASQEITEAGQKVYGRVCSNCHGESGDGRGPTGISLPVKSRDFTNCKFQRKRTDGELFYVIKFGSWQIFEQPPLF